MAGRTLLRASWIIAYDGHQHRLLRDGVIVWKGDTIIHVGEDFDGPIDEMIDATGKAVTPGFISTHAHIGYGALGKSFLEDRGLPQFYYSPLYEELPLQVASQDEEGDRACVDAAMVELLRSGCTTICELQTSLSKRPKIDEAIEQALQIGMRFYICPTFRSARWYTPDGNRVEFEWDEEAGNTGLRQAVAAVEKWNGKGDDTIRVILAAAHTVDVTEELLRDTRRAAEELQVPITIHAAESILEFQEIIRRHGKTPIEWLRDLEFLGPDVILGHAHHISGTSWVNYPPGDLDIMVETGVSVSHSPWTLFKKGVMMESFPRYLRAGVNMSIGTDGSPQSAIVAMRFATVIGKAQERDNMACTAADAFNAATLGGARALGRDDLGRIAPGAKADLVVWDATTLSMSPMRDPVRNIVFDADTNDVESVFINGAPVMVDRTVLNADDDTVLAERLQAAATRMWGRVPEHDRAGRTVDEFSPQSFAYWGS